MSDALLLLGGLLASVVGMGLFALSIDAHWRQVMGERLNPLALRIGLRAVGALMLLASFLLCAAADPVTMAMLVWPMLLTIAAAIVASGLTVHAKLGRKAA